MVKIFENAKIHLIISEDFYCVTEQIFVICIITINIINNIILNQYTMSTNY